MALVLQIDKLTRSTRTQQTHTFKVSLLGGLVVLKTVLLPLAVQVVSQRSLEQLVTGRAISSVSLYLLAANTACFAC